MNEKWDYAELSHNVKMGGGPKKFIDTIKEGCYQKGIEEGRKQKNPVIAIALFGGIVAGVGGVKIYQGIKQHIKNKKRKENVREMRISEAEQQFINEFEHQNSKEKLTNIDIKFEVEEIDDSQNEHIVKLEEKVNEEE